MHFTKNTKSVGPLGPTGPYATPASAEDRTFELTVDYIYELWLVVTFTGWFGEKLWTTEQLSFNELCMQLTYKEKTLTFADLRWPLDRVFRLQRGSETLRCELTRASQRHHDVEPSKTILDTLVQKVHFYLAGYMSAVLGDAAAAKGDWSVRVLNKVVLPRGGP